MRSSLVSARARSTVSVTSGRGPPSGSSCLGRAGVLTGQKREPTPPARTVTQKWGSEAVEDFFDSGKQLLRAEGLRHEVVGAETQRFVTIGVLPLGGEDHHRYSLPVL